MKLSYNVATSAENATLEQDLQLAEKYGYDLIEIQYGKLVDYLKDHSLQDLADFFANSHLKPFTLNAMGGFAFQDEKGWAQAMEKLDFYCEVGKAIGCNTLITIPAFGLGVSKTISEIREEHVRTIRLMDERCRKNGIVMNFAIEFCGAPACSINQLGYAYDTAIATGLENVGVVLDCFHFYTMGSTWEDLDRLDVNKLFVLHVDDSEELPVGAGTDKQRLWPGDGFINLNRIFSTLKAKGYDKVGSVELFRPEYYELPADDTIRIAKEKTLAVLTPHWTMD